MCVIFFALNMRPDLPLVLLANRDEFYARPTQAAGYWDDFPHIYGGRDLQLGGTWLAVTASGRFAAVTNYRDPSAPKGTRSRGDLVKDFLIGEMSAESYIDDVDSCAGEFSGFNLLVGEFSQDRQTMRYFSNRGPGPRELSPGIYGLSNHLLDTPWPKVAIGKARFSELVASDLLDRERFFKLLTDPTMAADDELPSTGIPYAAEKALSAIFIKTPDYGTRCSTLLTFDDQLKWDLEERVYI